MGTGTVARRRGERSTLREKWVLIVGGLVIVALIAILMAATASVDSFLYLGLDSLKRQTLGHLAPDVSPVRRAALARAFDGVVAAATARRLSEEEVGGFARACRAALADGRVTAAEATALTDAALALAPRAGG